MLLLKVIYNGVKTLNEICERDERLTHYPLIGKPWPMFTIMGLYLLIVLKWGPMLMENRKPYNGMKYFYLRDDFSLLCQKYDLSDRTPDTMKLIRPVVLYYASKYLDLCDTIFFLLRKKYNQITFLHVYHHAIMIFAAFVYCVNLFSSQFTATGVVNSFVHVCMYTYYFVAAAKPGINLEKWKRYLTRIQLLQFLILAIVIAIPLFNNWCNLPLQWLLIMFLQNTFMIVLFSNFYYKAYILKDSEKKKISNRN